jgi:hypothetical protein
MLQALPLALWIAAPVLLGGLTLVAVIRWRLLSDLAAIPLDAGASWRGHRVFGENKTLRGVLVMIGATVCWTSIQVWLSARWAWSSTLIPEPERALPLAWGVLTGAGYILGELPNSFIKRQLGIAPGDTSRGGTAPLLWVIDQLDSMAGVLLMLLPVWTPSLPVALALCGVTLVIHPIVALLMFLLGLKTRIG